MFNESQNWNYHFKSVVIDGFLDNNDMAQIRNNNMVEDDDMNETITVSDYMRNLINPTNNEPMFEYVYPSIGSKREVIVTINQLGEVNFNYSKGELAKDMTNNNIKLEFTTPSEVITSMRLIWKPFTRIANIRDTSVKNNKNQIMKKRSRINSEEEIVSETHDIMINSKTNPDKSYYQAASKINNNNITIPYSNLNNIQLSTKVKELQNIVNKLSKKSEDNEMICKQNIDDNNGNNINNMNMIQYMVDKKLATLENKLNEKIENQTAICVDKSTDKMTELLGQFAMVMKQSNKDNYEKSTNRLENLLIIE